MKTHNQFTQPNSNQIRQPILSQVMNWLLVITLLASTLFAALPVQAATSTASQSAITAQPVEQGNEELTGTEVASAAADVEVEDIHMQIKQPTTVETNDCEKDKNGNSLPCTHPSRLTLALRTHKVENKEEDIDEIVATSIATADIQFHPLPTLPLNAAVTGATLVIPGAVYGDAIPVIARDLALGGNPQVASKTLTHNLSLTRHVGTDCYNRFHAGKECSAERVPMELRMELPASLINGWYAVQQVGGQNAGLRLEIANDDCLEIVSSVHDGRLTESCDFLAEGDAQLQIFYDESTLAGASIATLAPSYDPTRYGRSVHEYGLQNQNNPWVGVASYIYNNGGQSLNMAQTPLNLRTNINVSRELVFAQGASEKPVAGAPPNPVNYAVIDNTSNGPFSADLWVELRGTAANNNVNSSYQVQRFPSLGLPDPTQEGTLVNLNIPFRSERFRLYDFNFAAKHSLMISVTAPTSMAIGLELFGSRPGLYGSGPSTVNQIAGAGQGRPDKPPLALPGNLSRTTITAKSTSDLDQRWALALTHAGNCPLGSATCPVQIELIACPEGMYPTERWGCQSLIFPHTSLFPEAGSGGTMVPATAVKNLASGVRIFSEGGFEENPTQQAYGPGNFDYCSKTEDKGMPLLGLTSDNVPGAPGQTPPQRLIAVMQGSVCVTHEGQIEVTGTPGYGAVVGPAVREKSARPAQIYSGNVSVHHGALFEAFGDLASGRGRMQSIGSGLVLQPVNATNDSLIQPWDPSEWPGMSTTSRIEIDKRSATGVDSGVLPVIVESVDNKVNINLNSTWEVVGNYNNQNFDFAAQSDTVPPDMDVASLTVRFQGPVQLQSTMGYDNPKINELHLPEATIHQSPQMGGAYKPIQAVLVSAGASRSDGFFCDGAACLDLRNASNINSATWAMPDIDVNGEAGLMMLQSAGLLQVYSNDHPDAALMAAHGMNANDFSADFNFKTFGASVSIKQEACIVEGDPSYDEDQEYPKVTVIRGVTSLALPSLSDGSDASSPGLVAEFKLCQTQLRQVKLSFNAFPPGISVGPSGLLLKGISGTVWVDPAYVRIEVEVTFQSADGVTFNNGSAKMTIDTRGYFALGGGAKLVGTFDLDGQLSVAWNPLDILQEASLSYQDWFSGFMRMHVWRGQGWGDPAPYPWLPDNNDFHFTGTIGAVFTIEKGRIGKFFEIDLPRNDLEIGVEVSFGEFCTNDACTSYEWGVQGKITVLKFTIGAYIGKSVGVTFFIGDKDRTLIDADLGLQAAAIGAVPTAPISDLKGGKTLDFAGDGEGPCPLQSDGKVATCTFTIEPDTGQALITVGWVEGTMPTAILHSPDGTAISGLSVGATPLAMAGVQAWEMNAGGLVQFSLDDRGALYTIENPQAGTWQLTLDNLTGDEAYSVLFAANSPVPQLQVTSPNNVAAGNSLDIQWTLTQSVGISNVQLSYINESAYLSYTQGLTAGEPITSIAHLRGGVPIAFNVPAAAGSYQWQPVGLANGTYYVVGRVDHPIHGSVYSFSPGSFSYVDNTAPAVPANLLLSSEIGSGADGLVASWDRNGEADLSIYEVIYSTPDLDSPSGFSQRHLRIPASDRNLAHPTRERVRLVGLLTGMETTACVRAIDASGNASACSASVNGTPQPSEALKPPHVNLTSATAPSGSALAATWTTSPLYDGYLLSWGYGCGAIFSGPAAQEGASNLNVGDVGNKQLNNLPVGTYRLAVRGYQREVGVRATIGWIGDYSNLRTVLLSNNSDGDGDGLPDGWAQHYDVAGAGADPDGDGLNNGFEKQYMTDPTNPDSDGDGFADGAEVFSWLTEPCDPASVPSTNQSARLIVTPSEGSLRFEASTGKQSNDVKRLRIWNRGYGLMNWQASASAPWIKLSANNGGPLKWTMDPHTVEVRVDTTGLTPGYYEGAVRVEGVTGSPVVNSPYEIPVRLWVLRKAVENQTRIMGYVFLDANGNGVEDANEKARVAGVNISLINAMGATMASELSKVNTGLFDFSQAPLANYTILATPADPDLVVTTPNPQPIQLAKGQELITDIRIGVQSQTLEVRDSDQDGVLDRDEDLNGNGNFKDDDTDLDGIANYLDPDDDNDGTPTALEGGGDGNGNGIADYLEAGVIGNGGGSHRVFLPLVSR